MRSIQVVPLAFLAAVLFSTPAFGQADPTTGGLDGTAHDLRSRLAIGQVCQPCHAPHNGVAPTDGPLWNHMVTSQSFTREGASITLTGSTKLCMSCHDGVTAVGNFGGITTNGDLITGDEALGTDLTATHPIGFIYADANTHIFEAEADVASYLEDGKVECGSCHYAHGGQDGKFLRVTIGDSQLCRVCHTF